ncbi:hypothetical protein GGR56DRAFT_619364 [Xylariaceae sp. FL0804]|nr:hypothetical protein GGR56DRAFT_619364 [Xylariaceae sp. FL0804]
MAPSGPRKGSAPRNGRQQNPTERKSRGGISKRQGRGTKIDRDGDLDMDASVGAGGPSMKRGKNPPPNGPASRGSTRPPRPTAKAQQIIQRVVNGGGHDSTSRVASLRSARSGRKTEAPNVITLSVEGLKASKASSNEGGGLKDLLIFLERKASTIGQSSRAIRIKKSQINGDFVYITAIREDADEILKLNNFMFAGATLHITEAPEGMPSQGAAPMSSKSLELKEQLRTVLSTRYDANTKLLNLSALGEDSVLSAIGVFRESTPEKMFRALMAICDGLFKTPKEKREAVVSISLAGNNVNDVLQIMSLIDTFPDLINLDLSRNQFRDLKGLQKWRSRLRQCQTLLLNDNPIEVAVPQYHQEVMTWFPKLQNLSGVQVRTPEQVAAEEAAARPTPMPQHGADFRDINRVGEGFIMEFIQAYDTDRQGLAAKYYDEQSTFSVAFNSRSPRTSDVQSPSWGSYIKFSRNHTRITTTSARQQRLFTGTNLIQNVWQQLPPTRHPDLVSQFDKYLIDCHPIPGLMDPSGQNPLGVDGMVLTMHGEFEDQEPGTMNTAKRSFSRTFVIGPGAPGRNPIRVVSDMLALKNHSVLPTATAQPVAQSGEDAQKEQMIVELCKRTSMVPEYSRFCLEGANWNFDQALVSFNEKRGDLPADAFAKTA